MTSSNFAKDGNDNKDDSSGPKLDSKQLNELRLLIKTRARNPQHLLELEKAFFRIISGGLFFINHQQLKLNLQDAALPYLNHGLIAIIWEYYHDALIVKFIEQFDPQVQPRIEQLFTAFKATSEVCYRQDVECTDPILLRRRSEKADREAKHPEFESKFDDYLLSPSLDEEGARIAAGIQLQKDNMAHLFKPFSQFGNDALLGFPDSKARKGHLRMLDKVPSSSQEVSMIPQMQQSSIVILRSRGLGTFTVAMSLMKDPWILDNGSYKLTTEDFWKFEAITWASPTQYDALQLKMSPTIKFHPSLPKCCTYSASARNAQNASLVSIDNSLNTQMPTPQQMELKENQVVLMKISNINSSLSPILISNGNERLGRGSSARQSGAFRSNEINIQNSNARETCEWVMLKPFDRNSYSGHEFVVLSTLNPIVTNKNANSSCEVFILDCSQTETETLSRNVTSRYNVKFVETLVKSKNAQPVSSMPCSAPIANVGAFSYLPLSLDYDEKSKTTTLHFWTWALPFKVGEYQNQSYFLRFMRENMESMMKAKAELMDCKKEQKQLINGCADVPSSHALVEARLGNACPEVKATLPVVPQGLFDESLTPEFIEYFGCRLDLLDNSELHKLTQNSIREYLQLKQQESSEEQRPARLRWVRRGRGIFFPPAPVADAPADNNAALDALNPAVQSNVANPSSATNNAAGGRQGERRNNYIKRTVRY